MFSALYALRAVADLEEPLSKRVRIIFGQDEESGRMRDVEAYLQSNFGKFHVVAGFYQKTLPQLGWKLQKEEGNYISFVRESEELEISQVSQLPLIVRVTLTGQH